MDKKIPKRSKGKVIPFPTKKDAGGTAPNAMARPGSLFNVVGGTFNFERGGVVKNTKVGEYGIIRAMGGTLNFDGAIHDNTALVSLARAGLGAWGSAIYIGGAAVNIRCGMITGNRAEFQTGGDAARGGAVCLAAGSLMFTGGAIAGNTNGGAFSGKGIGIYAAGGALTLAPSAEPGNIFNISDVIYLANGTLIRIGATLANLPKGSLTVQCADPVDGLPVAAVSGGYALFDPVDLSAFRYVGADCGFKLNGDATRIVLAY
jgi:hypothetical protein